MNLSQDKHQVLHLGHSGPIQYRFCTDCRESSSAENYLGVLMNKLKLKSICVYTCIYMCVCAQVYVCMCVYVSLYLK